MPSGQAGHSGDTATVRCEEGGDDWIVDIDLEKFFDTVNHDKLMTIIGRTIKDGDVISIVRKYLVNGIMIDDEYEDSIVGTPQ